MATATQSAHEKELSARLREAADQGLSAALDAKMRSQTPRRMPVVCICERSWGTLRVEPTQTPHPEAGGAPESF